MSKTITVQDVASLTPRQAAWLAMAEQQARLVDTGHIAAVSESVVYSDREENKAGGGWSRADVLANTRLIDEICARLSHETGLDEDALGIYCRSHDI